MLKPSVGPGMLSVDPHFTREGIRRQETRMSDRPRMKLTGIVLDSPSASELADFYRRLLGWQTRSDEPGWVTLRSPDGGAGLSFQDEPNHLRPSWPAEPGDQQMMVHLDILVDDLQQAADFAAAAGATLADYQPQPDVRVFLDPAGHPFCLFLTESG